ncbi:MAG: hypothetical protein IPG23_11705 [Burkholderiales bacterium]|nr:hypothetical protein [Burkholderiales bacterium]
MFRSLIDDFYGHLTPQLKRLSRDKVSLGVDDITPVIQELEKKHGRALVEAGYRERLVAVCSRPDAASNPAHFWRLIYMVIPRPLRRGACAADPWS